MLEVFGDALDTKLDQNQNEMLDKEEADYINETILYVQQITKYTVNGSI